MKIKDFNGLTAYITGASSGIGLATAKSLAARGANIVVLDIAPCPLSDIEKCRLSPAQKIAYVQLDVSQREMAEQALPAAVKEYGPPDILVNSAGISHPQEFWNTSYETFDKIIKVNLYGTVNMTGILLPYLKESKGYIVNLSSIAGFIGVFSMTPNNFELDFPAKQTVNGSESSVSVLNGGEFRTVPELLFEKRGLIQLAQQLLFSP